MPPALLAALRRLLPGAAPFLMYGLTEAFRSTYLPPGEVDRRPGSIGRAIPNAEVLVLRDDGSPCAAGEEGELVHRGPLVSLGYWNAPELTARRFRPVPHGIGPAGQPEYAVWSGDRVVTDEDGFLYFRGRRDEQIKSSGYRISPTEIEEVVLASSLVAEAVAVGVPDDRLGERVAIAAVATNPANPPTAALLLHCQQALPPYMVPARITWCSTLPRNANGKHDRAAIKSWLAGPGDGVAP